MGNSAKDSRLYFLPPACPIKLNGEKPSGTLLRFYEQVVRIEINPSVYQRKYGHDKSEGCQDVCSGIKSWDGSITTRLNENNAKRSLVAGDVVWLECWPLGDSCGDPLHGYASIDTDPIVMNLENGDPVEHNYRYSSKGKWANASHAPGTYACGCNAGEDGGGSGGSGWFGSGGGGGDSEFGLPADAAIAVPHQTPVTGYQWNGTAWIQVYDECEGAYVQGPQPTTPGTFQGELRLVPCLAA